MGAQGGTILLHSVLLPCVAVGVIQAPRLPESMAYSYTPTFFQHFPKYHAPHLKPGEELRDPLEELKPKCLVNCSEWLSEYNECVNRISLRTDGKGNCKGQFEEMSQCQDHCIAHELFGHMK